MPHINRTQPGSFRGPLGDCPALESSDRGTNQAESHRAGLGWAGLGGPRGPETDPHWSGAPRRLGRDSGSRGAEPPTYPLFYAHQKMTKNSDLGLPPICSVIPDQGGSWASVSLTLGRCNPSCLFHGDVGGGGRLGEHQMSEGLWVSVWEPLTPLPRWVGGDTAPWCRSKAEKGQPEAREVKTLHRRPCPQVAPLTRLCL